MPALFLRGAQAPRFYIRIHLNTPAPCCKESSLHARRGCLPPVLGLFVSLPGTFHQICAFLQKCDFPCVLFKKFKNPLVIFRQTWYVVSNKSETWIHPLFGAATSAPHTLLFLTLLFSSFTFLSFTLPVPQGTRKAMTHLHGLSLFLLPAGGQSTSRQSTALQDDVPQLLFPVPPQKVCLNKHPCFFLTSLCMRVILISVN